ncbi:MAG: Amidophosphoribosyltransferase [Pseudomonas citronellolis]|nr:MAG: Amidophosphoribosyltransferase [Pseudomonas citronellolis]
MPLCSGCHADLPWLGPQCQHCALPLPVEGLICGGCLQHPPRFDQVFAAWRYAFPVDSLITGFKHHARGPQGRLLGQLLARHLAQRLEATRQRPDILLPVPLAPRRQRQRGFNQAALLAHWIAQPLKLAVAERWLRRTLETPPQQGLDARARRRNLRQAFELAPECDVDDRHVALVDDVLTTGATAEALARLLRRAGARRVDVYCLARTPAPGD